MNEDIVEQAATGWFESLGFDIRKGADISPGPTCSKQARCAGTASS